MLPSFDNTEIAFRYKSNRDLNQAHFLFSFMNSSQLTKLGIGFTSWAMKIGLPINGIIKQTIFKQFCGGENLSEAALTAQLLAKYDVGIILDYGVEGKEDEKEYDKAVPEFVKTIEYAAGKKNIPFIALKITGFARFSLMEKVNNKEPLAEAEQEEWQRVVKRINTICEAAFKHKVKVSIDAEETWIQEAGNELVDAMMLKYNKVEAIIFNTFQLYCHGSLPFLKYCYDWAKENGIVYGAKLVRGAYMEKERARSIEKGYPSPIQPNKEATDKDYDEAVIFCLKRLDTFSVFIGTHNEKSSMIGAQYMMEHNIPTNHSRVIFSQLLGMSDNITFNLASEGFHVAKYLPYGPVKDVVPYLMRRAQENTSVKGQTGRELSLIKKELQRRKQ